MDHISSEYKKQSLYVLNLNFRRISVAAINRCFQHNNGNFTEAYNCLQDIVNIVDDVAARNRRGIVGDEILERQEVILERADFLRHLHRVALSRPRSVTSVAQRQRIEDDDLIREMGSIPEMNDWLHAKKAAATKKKRTRTISEPIDLTMDSPGSDKENDDVIFNAAEFSSSSSPSPSKPPPSPAECVVECGCCYGEYPIEQMTHCNGADDLHFFCHDCVRNNINEQVYGKNGTYF